MAIDPTAPVHPIIPTVPAGTAVDSSAILQALARQALAGSTAQLADIAGQVSGKAAQASGRAASAAQAVTQDAGHSAGALDGRATPTPGAPGTALTRPPPDPRTVRVVRQATAEAVPRQAGLAPLMADLQAFVDQPDAPPEVRDAGRALLSTTPTIPDITTAPGLRRAVERSGVLLETHLARAAESSPPPANAPRPMITEGDLKAALWVFRGALSAWLAKVEPPSSDVSPPVAPDPEGDSAPEADPLRPLSREAVANGARGNPGPAIVSLSGRGPFDAEAVETPSLQATRAPPAAAPYADSAAPAAALTRTMEPEADPELAARFGAFVAPPQKSGERPPIKIATPGASLPALVQLEPLEAEGEPPPSPSTEPRALVARGYAGPTEERSKTPPPPYAGGPTAGQKPMEPNPQLLGTPEAMARRLLKGTQSALARQDLMQIASLPESVVHEQEAAEPRTLSPKLAFDLPFVTPQGVAVAQFEISRDGSGAGGGGAAPLEQTYRARFSIDVEPLGPVHAQVVLAGARARVSLWAERSETIARLRAGEEALGAALRQAELTPEVAVHSGAPPIAGSGPVGHFVDQAS